MKPFNLERAIAGDPIVTRDGRPAQILAHDLSRRSLHPYFADKMIVAVGSGDTADPFLMYDLRGFMPTTGKPESSFDLFMTEPAPTVKYVNISSSDALGSIPGKLAMVFDTEALAKEHADIPIPGVTVEHLAVPITLP